jgi:hypothetical protein
MTTTTTIVHGGCWCVIQSNPNPFFALSLLFLSLSLFLLSFACKTIIDIDINPIA